MPESGTQQKQRSGPLMVLLIIGVAVTATANNFAGRIKAQIFGDYNFVTVIPDSILQLAFYSIALGIQICRKKVHPAQFRYLLACGKSWSELGAWKFLVLAGVNDVANQVTGLASQPHLTAFMMSLMDQATTPFTVLFSMLLLGTRYILLEWLAMLVIVAAAAACVVIADNTPSSGNSTFWATFAALTTSFAALSYVLKEMSFTGYNPCELGFCGPRRSLSFTMQVPGLSPMQRRLRDADPEVDCGPQRSVQRGLSFEVDSLDVFLVSAFISFVSLLSSVPIALMNHAAVAEGPAWPALVGGLRALWEREHAMTAYLVYVAINTVFNLALILTTSYGSALLCFLSLKAAVPLTAILSAVDWPFIGAAPLNEAEWVALCFVVAGITAFRFGNVQRQRLLMGS